MNVNSKQYWDTIFALGQWKANGGEEQTRYFAEAQCRFFRMHRNFSGTILDFGCGLGDAFPVYRKFFPKAKLLGVDFSESAIEICKQKYGDFVEFVRGEARDVPEVDIIVASNVLEHLKNDKEITNILCGKCKELYLTVPYREQHLIEEHVNIYDRNSFNEFSPQNIWLFPCKGWSQYGIRSLWWQFYFKNILRPFLGKSIQRRRLLMMMMITQVSELESMEIKKHSTS